MEVCMIVAANPAGVIGVNNQLPWVIPEDLQYFKNTTMGRPVVMGRKTYESIGRPLPGRPNYVLSRRTDALPGVTLINTPMVPHSDTGQVFIIGGSEVYKAYESIIDSIYLTVVNKDIVGDAYLPFEISSPVWELESAHYIRAKDGTPLCYQQWTRSKR